MRELTDKEVIYIPVSNRSPFCSHLEQQIQSSCQERDNHTYTSIYNETLTCWLKNNNGGINGCSVNLPVILMPFERPSNVWFLGD